MSIDFGFRAVVRHPVRLRARSGVTEHRPGLFSSQVGKWRIRVLLLLPLSCFSLPRPASAQQIEALALRFDNDALALPGSGAPPDHDYTSGLYLRAEFGSASGPLRRWMAVAQVDNLSGHLGVGQRIYTPRQDGAELVPGERPYAGWLFVDAGVNVAGARVEHLFGLEVGVTGPSAFGEPVQNGFHRLIGSRVRQGWDRQLRAEVAGLVRYGIAGTHPVAGARLRPQAEVAVGTLWSGAAGGLEVRFGAAPDAPGLSVSAGLRQEWVARNLFLDGNTFHTSVIADKRALVRQAGVGIGYGFEHWTVEYHLVVRSREYVAQPGAHGYGSALFRWRK